MLKSCYYCGRIHDEVYVCENKKSVFNMKSSKKVSKAVKFRSSYEWTKIRDNVLKRDRYCCVICNKQNGGDFRKFNSDFLEVHHIEPVEENFELRNKMNNLITVCRNHHEACEKGDISRQTQRSFIYDADYDFEVVT